MIERIYLTGFMTSGKSTIGPIVANVLGWDFYDLDKVIEDDHNASVVEIFKQHGEEYFRTIETKTLTQLSQKKNTVIALGGGTFSSDTNYNIAKSTGKVIYLRISAETIYQRLKNKIDRPLIRDLVLNQRPKEEFVERITNILTHRSQYYEKSDLIIDTDNNRIGVTVDYLASLLRKMLHEENKSDFTP